MAARRCITLQTGSISCDKLSSDEKKSLSTWKIIKLNGDADASVIIRRAQHTEKGISFRVSLSPNYK